MTSRFLRKAGLFLASTALVAGTGGLASAQQNQRRVERVQQRQQAQIQQDRQAARQQRQQQAQLDQQRQFGRPSVQTDRDRERRINEFRRVL